ISLTSMLFYLFGSSNFLARFWPALAGSALVWAPYFVRSKLGQNAAWMMAFGLALDPGLVAVSRLVGGPALALSFTVLALTLAVDRRWLLAGILAGLALLAGPALLTGLVVLLLAWLIWHGLPKTGIIARADPLQQPPGFSRRIWPAGIAALATVVLVATLAGSFPQGLGAWANTIPAYLSGWLDFQVPGLRLLVALLVYQPLASIFGLVGLVIAGWRKSPPALFLSIWLLATLAWLMVYPARQVSDLVWLLVPLWGLAAQVLAQVFNASTYRLTVYAHAAALFILLALVWLNLQGLNSAVESAAQWRWVVIIGALLLGGLASLLVAMGWSMQAAREGLAIGLLAGLGVYVLANLFWVSQNRPNNLRELWYPAPTVASTQWFEETLVELALAASGTAQHVEIVATVQPPSLRWVLRNQQALEYQQVLSTTQLPLIIITSLNDGEIHQVQAYSGQDFVWREYPAWQGVLPPNWTGWLTDRVMPIESESLVIWARSDLFPLDLQLVPGEVNQEAVP
ncbi:MAG: glycosyltransferase family 39 protein, partial [Anaerolineales bacterium]|nr:glycosyltransferase family 39 protein [Anaerolineales bacterium]